MPGARSAIESKIDSMFGTSGDDDADETLNNEQQSQQQEQNDGEEGTQPPVEGQQDNAGGQAARQDGNARRDGGAGEGGQQQRGAQHNRGGQGAQGGQQQQRTLPANNRGDLVDPQTGAVIARAGNERRFYEAARNAQGQVAQLRTEFDRVNAQLEAFREAAVLPQQLGLAPAEVTNAMQWFAHWKKNPVEAATAVLTELRKMGYEVEGLGGAVDMGAIRQMVQEAVSPFRQDREAQQREQEVAAQVDRELTALYTQFPWARGQQQELMNLLEADQTLTIREAALHLQAYALQRGLDLSKPLREQVLTAQNGGQQQQQQRPNNARVPAPGQTGDAPIVPRRVTSAGHERSNRDIVKEAMREAGLNVEHL